MFPNSDTSETQSNETHECTAARRSRVKRLSAALLVAMTLVVGITAAGAALGRRGGRDGRRSRRCGRRRRAGPEGPELAQHRLRRARSHGAHGQVGLGRHRHLGCQHPRCRFTLRHRRRRLRQLLALRHGGDGRLVHDAALFMRGRQSHRSLRRPRARRHVRLDRDRGHARGLGSLRCTRLGRLRRGSRDWQHVSRHRRLLHAGHRRNRQHPARGLRQPSRRVPAQRLQLPLG